MSKTVLIIGSGGREHALAWKLAQSPQVGRVWVAPGNGGTSWPAGDGLAPSENVAIAETDFDGLIAFAQKHDVDLTVVGPEAPLAAGAVDRFQAAGLRIFGPSQAAAQLEASKAFSKAFMAKHNIPTAAYKTFTDAEAAKSYIRSLDKPVVVKASGLAAGKGVLVCDTVDDALGAVDTIMAERAFGAAGDTVVVEERLFGDELSVLAFSDGERVVPMMVARDHKRALDGDKGLNTGGMGAFAPTLDVTPDDIAEIRESVLIPTVQGMRAAGTPYIGVLYAGLMRTADGWRVLEFNCRFGDPETQVVLPMLDGDLYAIMNACIDGSLDERLVQWHDGACATVVLASPGYPQAYPKGLPITIGDLQPSTLVFHAGTKRAEDGALVTSGGRVMAVTARANTLAAALQHVYDEIQHIHFEGMHYRRDIGKVHHG